MVADVFVDDGVALSDYFAGRLVHHVAGQHTAGQLRQAQVTPGRILQVVDPDALLGVAVVFVHDHVLRYVDQPSRQVARVGRADSRAGQAPAGAVRGEEVLEHGQTPAAGPAT